MTTQSKPMYMIGVVICAIVCIVLTFVLIKEHKVRAEAKKLAFAKLVIANNNWVYTTSFSGENINSFWSGPRSWKIVLRIDFDIDGTFSAIADPNKYDKPVRYTGSWTIKKSGINEYLVRIPDSENDAPRSYIGGVYYSHFDLTECHMILEKSFNMRFYESDFGNNGKMFRIKEQ